jgi:hypothetical protein
MTLSEAYDVFKALNTRKVNTRTRAKVEEELATVTREVLAAVAQKQTDWAELAAMLLLSPKVAICLREEG